MLEGVGDGDDDAKGRICMHKTLINLTNLSSSHDPGKISGM